MKISAKKILLCCILASSVLTGCGASNTDSSPSISSEPTTSITKTESTGSGDYYESSNPFIVNSKNNVDPSALWHTENNDTRIHCSLNSLMCMTNENTPALLICNEENGNTPYLIMTNYANYDVGFVPIDFNKMDDTSKIKENYIISALEEFGIYDSDRDNWGKEELVIYEELCRNVDDLFNKITVYNVNSISYFRNDGTPIICSDRINLEDIPPILEDMSNGNNVASLLNEAELISDISKYYNVEIFDNHWPPVDGSDNYKNKDVAFATNISEIELDKWYKMNGKDFYFSLENNTDSMYEISLKMDYETYKKPICNSLIWNKTVINDNFTTSRYDVIPDDAIENPENYVLFKVVETSPVRESMKKFNYDAMSTEKITSENTSIKTISYIYNDSDSPVNVIFTDEAGSEFSATIAPGIARISEYCPLSYVRLA